MADTNNHRIQVRSYKYEWLHSSLQVFEKNGTFRYQFGIPGKEEGQLWYPRKVTCVLLKQRMEAGSHLYWYLYLYAI